MVEWLLKKDEAVRFGVGERSIQRDIQNIRDFLMQEKENAFVQYDYSRKAFVFAQTSRSSSLRGRTINYICITVQISVELSIFTIKAKYRLPLWSLDLAFLIT